MTLRTRPVMAALIPDRKVLAMEVLRPFEELKDPAELSITAIAKLPAEVKMAKLLIRGTAPGPSGLCRRGSPGRGPTRGRRTPRCGNG